MNALLTKKVAKLEHEKQTMLKKVEGLSIKQLNQQPEANSWSAGQVIDHLLGAENKVMDYIEKKIQDPTVLKPASLKTKLRSTILNISLKSSIKFKAPKAVAIAAENNDLVQLTNDWNQTRERLNKLLKNLDKSLLDKEIFRHPTAGRINMYQTLEFMTLHINHHQMQIDSILNKINRS